MSCALLFVFVSFSSCRVFSSSVVRLTTLGEHGKQRQEASPTYGGQPGGSGEWVDDVRSVVELLLDNQNKKEKRTGIIGHKLRGEKNLEL